MKTQNILILLLSLFLFSCENDKAVEDTDNHKDTTIIIHEEQPAQNTEPAPKAADEKPKPAEKPKEEPKETVNWHALMDEYHELLCRRHKGNPEPNDAIRQVELTKELNDVRETLPKDERFEFGTAMARAANMASCK